MFRVHSSPSWQMPDSITGHILFVLSTCILRFQERRLFSKVTAISKRAAYTQGTFPQRTALPSILHSVGEYLWGKNFHPEKEYLNILEILCLQVSSEPKPLPDVPDNNQLVSAVTALLSPAQSSAEEHLRSHCKTLDLHTLPSMPNILPPADLYMNYDNS